jgi:peptidoglycan/xylan/chitin deacetylase (PgdA/CDA1 family)
VVTFDDGWIDTYTEAWPLLKQFAVPAAVFLPIAYIGTGRLFWQEELQHVLVDVRRRADGDASFAAAVRSVLEAAGCSRVLTAPMTELRETIAACVQLQKDGGPDGGRPLVDELRRRLGIASDAHPAADGFMTWAMAREMAQDGIVFGAHTVSHRLMTTLTPDELRDEVRRSRDVVKRELGRSALAFCYPNGDFNRAVIEEVEGAGFTHSFSTQSGSVSSDADRFSIKRVNIQEDMTSTDGMFMARILGLV